MASREDLIQRSISFLREVKDMTPGADMERWLNETYGESSALYRDLSRLIKIGVEEGWAANQEVDGPNYRRSRIVEPTAETFQFSLTAVYMNSAAPRRFKDEDDCDVLRGQYHGHPYGEINLVVPLNEGAELKGLQGWQGPGWTAPEPGSRHFPEVKGGAVIALFYLPAGRISYDYRGSRRLDWRNSTTDGCSPSGLATSRDDRRGRCRARQRRRELRWYGPDRRNPYRIPAP